MAFEVYTHTVQDVITDVTRQFGDEAEIQINSADIVRWTNSAQAEIFQLNSTINEVAATADIVNAQDKYPILSDAAFTNLNTIHSILVDGKPLDNLEFNDALRYIVGSDLDATGDPTIWYLKAGILHFWPKPDRDIPDGFTIYFNRKPAKVTGAGDSLGIPDNFYNAVLQLVLSYAYEMDENPQMAQMKTQQAEKSINIQQNQTTPQTQYFPTIQVNPEDYI
jgi:hypothetical protein